MIIERELTPYVVLSEDPLLRALEKITANQQRIIFCVSADGRLEGVLSDGDFRRWVTERINVDLLTPVSTIANSRPVSASATAAPSLIRSLFRPGLDHVALIDERGRLVGIAVNRADRVPVAGRMIGDGEPVFVVAEIGINHNGSVELARRLVEQAAAAGADCVKFQMRNLDALYRRSTSGIHAEDLGPQYTIDLLRKFELTSDDLFSVFEHAERLGLVVMCTPWDLPSLEALGRYGLPALKIASADLTHHDLLREATKQQVPLVISTGMSTESEIVEAVEIVRATGVGYSLLHCQSAYPAPFKDLNLRYLRRLAEIGRCPVGYSGHERGFHIPLAAVAMGARIIEKHFTIDRHMEGNDHKVSLLPEEFAEMVRRIRELEEALGDDRPRVVSTGELMNRVNLAKSLVAARPLAVGETITRDAVEVKSPGRGLQPNLLPRLLGRTVRRPLAAGDFFYAADLADDAPRRRQYRFRRPWGLPVRYHDFRALTKDVRPDFVEFHFSYNDLDVDPATFFAEPNGRLPMALACHSPDLFAGDFLLNLASEQEAHRKRSISELQRVIDTTRRLREWFECPEDPVVVASLGGFTRHRPAETRDLGEMYDRVATALASLDTSGVRLCAQTLPPFPWYMGGQMFGNLFVNADDTAAFVADVGLRLCLDVSHSKLAANHIGRPFADVVERLGPFVDHLHLVDAIGVDGEGVQIGEGEVDFEELAKQLDTLVPSAGFIPEIWQGHVNDGEGFWIALERLERWF